MKIFESLFGIEKPYFILGNGDKFSISSITKILMSLCTEKHQELGEKVIELIPEHLLTQKIKQSNRLNIIIISFQIAIYLQAVVSNTEIQNEHLIKLKNSLINETKLLTHKKQRIYQDEDMPYIEQFTINYYDCFNEYFNQYSSGRLIPDGPGTALIDDIIRAYELPTDIIPPIDKMLFSTIVLEQALQTMNSFGDGAIKWVH